MSPSTTQNTTSPCWATTPKHIQKTKTPNLVPARCPSPCKNPGFALRSGEVRILTAYLVGELAATTGLGSAYAGNSDADVDLILKGTIAVIDRK
jgi:hypothetical protein